MLLRAISKGKTSTKKLFYTDSIVRRIAYVCIDKIKGHGYFFI